MNRNQFFLLTAILLVFASLMSCCDRRNAWEKISKFNDLSFSPNDEFLIIANHDGRINVIDVNKTEYKKSLTHRKKTPIADVCFLPSGKQFVSCGTNSLLQIWDVNNFEFMSEFLDNNDCPTNIDVSNDGAFLAIGGERSSGNINDSEGRITIWNIKKMKFVKELIDNKYKSVGEIRFSPDSRFLASLSIDDSVILWNLKDMNAYKTLEGTGNWDLYSDISFSPDMKYCAFGGEPVTLYTMTSEENKNKFKSLPIRPPICFSKDGKYLAGIERNSVNEIVIMDTVHWKKMIKFNAIEGVIKKLSFDNSGRIIAGITHSKLWIWNINTKKPVVMFDENFKRKTFD